MPPDLDCVRSRPTKFIVAVDVRLSLAVALRTLQVTVRFSSVPPKFWGRIPWGGHWPPSTLTRGLAARRLFRFPSCREGTIHLHTSVPCRGFKPKLNLIHCRYFNNAFYLESNYAAPPTLYLTLLCFKDFRRVGDYKGNYMVEHVRLTHNSSVENNNYLGEWKGLNSRRRVQSTTDLPGGRLQ
ncbi:hypothetical protein TNCV_4950991 [Trichonephila clavipes]|nr:hypothetical protein TNCV_4950991 [Trichonephila clavipes]